LPAKFKINVREGVLELEGEENFVNKHLEKFEDIFKYAIKEVMKKEFENSFPSNKSSAIVTSSDIEKRFYQKDSPPVMSKSRSNSKQAKTSVTLPPIPVDLKSNVNKIGLREFFATKKPSNHYEKATLFVYYLTKFNKEVEVKYGEILSCYEEVEEKKPSIVDIIKNSIRYKGWLEQGTDKYTTRLTISGENFVKFDLPQIKNMAGHQLTIPSSTTSDTATSIIGTV
jgi:hypothetical protein